MLGRGVFGFLAGYHLLPCLLASAALALLLWFVFGFARVKRARFRVYFLYAALAKAAVALWLGAGISCLAPNAPLIGFISLRMPMVMPGHPLEPKHLPISFAGSPLWTAIGIGVALIIGGLCLYRWLRLLPLALGMALVSREPNTRQLTDACRLFDELVTRVWQDRQRLRPRLVLVSHPVQSAFTIGVMHPLVVLSTDLVEKLDERELRGILAHEIGHIVRYDYLGRWIATVLHDIMIWNLFVIWWYARLKHEQEKAADEYAAGLLNDPIEVAYGLLGLAALPQLTPSLGAAPLAAWRRERSLARLEERVSLLEQQALSNRAPFRSILPVLVGLFVFLVAQPVIMISLPHLWNKVSHLFTP